MKMGPKAGGILALQRQLSRKAVLYCRPVGLLRANNGSADATRKHHNFAYHVIQSSRIHAVVVGEKLLFRSLEASSHACCRMVSIRKYSARSKHICFFPIPFAQPFLSHHQEYRTRYSLCIQAEVSAYPETVQRQTDRVDEGDSSDQIRNPRRMYSYAVASVRSNYKVLSTEPL